MSIAQINQSSLNLLDWRVLAQALSQECSSDLACEWALDLEFSNSAKEARIRFKELSELSLSVDKEESPPFQGLSNLRPTFSAAKGYEGLDAEQLCSLRDFLFLLKSLKDWEMERGEDYPTINAWLKTINIDLELYSTLEKSFELDGSLSTQTYPLLARYKEQRGVLLQKIQNTLQERLNSLSSMLQDKYYTQRNGRYVLPMKATYKRSIGVVHGRSQSGETFYVEPLDLIPLANRAKELEVALEQEKRRIFQMLSTLVRRHLPFFISSMKIVARFDLLHAKYSLGKKLGGVIPIIGEQGCIHANNVQHPILLLGGGRVVPNTFRLDTQHAALIVSGPNAGGKTIALKSLGLLVWMMRAGIPVPTQEGSRIDFFSLIAADIGDAQQVETGLSTFSGHLLRLKEIVAVANESSLVLLDEIGMGTDPAQGSALAQATMEYLLSVGVRLVVTTHFSRLKALSQVDSRYVMAAAEFFDGHPTYQLSLGEVGHSHAFALAKKLSFPIEIVKKARTLLSSDERELGDLLLELEELRLASAQREEELRSEVLRLEKERKELERYRERQEKRKKEIEDEVRRAFYASLKESEDYVQELIRVLRQNPSMKRASMTIAELKNMQQTLSKSRAQEKKADIPLNIELKVGDLVSHKALGPNCEVVKILSNRRYQLRLRGMVFDCTHEEIAARQKRDKSKKTAPKKFKTAAPKKEFSAPRGDWNTCDLRGKRVEEAKRIVEKFFDAFGEGVVFVLHGHGTGVLKKAMRNWLGSSPYVFRFRPAFPHEGGDAFTVVELSDKVV